MCVRMRMYGWIYVCWIRGSANDMFGESGRGRAPLTAGHCLRGGAAGGREDEDEVAVAVEVGMGREGGGIGRYGIVGGEESRRDDAMRYDLSRVNVAVVIRDVSIDGSTDCCIVFVVRNE